ncbi:macrophage-expressed gene 1 protein-like [Saccostrea echinata]|uniref:macrophage-expressed gene 1 protein-like n=1 Tax=Saccostrea echinata TaxID=191078 RepID=UPI002A8134CB|nr:macrophage-expressed gene 1 protein-like [Saccostrea echinata]
MTGRLLWTCYIVSVSIVIPSRCLPSAFHCRISNSDILTLEVLPGGGWDNLKNEDRARIVFYNYTDCKVTEDGRYLIPENIFVVPSKASQVKIYSERIDHWMNFTSSTSKSINVGGQAKIAGLFSIGGKFSSEYDDVKKNQVNDNSFTQRTGAQYRRYISKLQPSVSLDNSFRSKIQSIASHHLNGRKRYARYESQLLVRDFGTHIITSIDAGASIFKVDQLNNSMSTNAELTKSEISAAAGVYFFGRGAGFDHASSVTDQMIQTYASGQTHSTVYTYGGQPYKPLNFSINDWVDGIGNDLVAVDKSGDPLHFLITKEQFPELPASIRAKTYDSVKAAISAYYKFNTYKGCTDINSPNFNFNANVDDGTCLPPGKNLTIGGIYQTCEFSGDTDDLCDPLTLKNKKTGTFDCGEGYQSALLYQGNVTKTEIRQVCESYMVFWKKCHDVVYYGEASYSTFWCYAHVGDAPPQSGYLFGGIYTETVANPVTKSQSCPPNYQPMLVTSDMYICLTDDFELGQRYSVPFAGFFSCQEGNPLSNQYFSPTYTSKSCPGGYSQHLGTISDECEVSYCTLANALFGQVSMPIRFPPFVHKPNEWNETGNYIISNEGQSWSTVFNVPDNFSGFDTIDREWIANNGETLSVKNLLDKRNRGHSDL